MSDRDQILQILQNLRLRDPPPLPPAPPKSMPKINKKPTPEKTSQKSSKSPPKGFPNGPQSEPKSTEFRKKCPPKRMLKKMCPKWSESCLSGPPPTSKVMLPCTWEHSFHISTGRPKVLQNAFHWHPIGIHWPPKWTKNLPTDPSKKLQKIAAIFDAPRSQN